VNALIRVEQVYKSFAQEQVLNDISFDVNNGEIFGIIGPNGSGKSTLLKLLSGVDPATSGTIELAGRKVASYSRKQLARWLAVLQQDALPPVGFTVRQVIEMGRYPFQSWLGDEADDHAVFIDAIMERLNLHKFADRTLDQLSGGERQRVALGKVMAQDPKLLMLDEPTTFLDIGYQLQMMDYIREWKQETGLTVIAVLHDLNLAAQYCDRILVLHEGRLKRIGTAYDVMDQDLIAEVYGTVPLIIPHPVSQRPQILLDSQHSNS
jgi:iron complex transport system ATP-binding protein